VNRFFLSLLLLISTSSEAALVLPPDLSTQEKQRAFARQIAKDMPGLAAGGYNQDTIINYLRLMQSLLVDRGLLKDEEFKKWAAERPDLKTYIFSTYRTE
jgi:hypothetical protein